MGLKKGIAHLILIVFIASVIILGWILVAKFIFKKGLPFTNSKEATVELKKEYKNPFDKNTQYVNPFDPYKSQFTHLR